MIHPTFSFNSDCLLNSCDNLIKHVTILFKWFLRTGTIPEFPLLCTIVPIVKDNLGDIASSDNYRPIAIGSLLLKWFDWLIIILVWDKLETVTWKRLNTETTQHGNGSKISGNPSKVGFFEVFPRFLQIFRKSLLI